MAGEPLLQFPVDPWLAGYYAAIDDVLELLGEIDVRRSSIAAPLVFGMRDGVAGLKGQRSSRAA